MKAADIARAREMAAALYARAQIVLRPDELSNLEIADFGLGMFEEIGLSLVVYVNTAHYCAKEMALAPRQICPEHRHAPLPAIGYAGKQETFRCRWGSVELYLGGTGEAVRPVGVSEARASYFTASERVLLSPGEQFTIPPDTLHWFRAGAEGAVVSEFSTHSYDEYDLFTDPAIRRIPTVEA